MSVYIFYFSGKEPLFLGLVRAAHNLEAARSCSQVGEIFVLTFYWFVWTFWKNSTQCCDIQWKCFSEALGSSRVVGQIQNSEHSRRTHLCLLCASSSK